MYNIFLSKRDLQKLTGCKKPAEQARWLKRERFQYRLDMAKRPVVLVSEVEARMSTPWPLWQRRAAVPDFDAI